MAIRSSVSLPDIDLLVGGAWLHQRQRSPQPLADRPRPAGLVDCAEYELLELVAVDLNGLLD
jgi:hypothetical protein